MAITIIDYTVFRKLKEARLVPHRPSVIELGEAEWYGDMALETLSECIEDHVPDPVAREQLHQRMVETECGSSPYKRWELAKIFYQVFLDYASITAIDFHGTPEALKLDLNLPVALDRQFDVLLNGGTAEHVFNVHQFFKTSHELTRPGGLMVHAMPFCGWVEHGFYSFNPTFYWDLAIANGYSLPIFAYTELSPPKIVQLTRREDIIGMVRGGELGRSALLYAVFRKDGSESAFRIPMQGVYAGNLTGEMVKAWQEPR